MRAYDGMNGIQKASKPKREVNLPAMEEKWAEEGSGVHKA